MFKLDIQPYLDNSMAYFRKHVGFDEATCHDEIDADRQFCEWLYPIYNCEIKTRKRDGFGLCFIFKTELDRTFFALRWS
jgi:hypothetical protein